MYRVVALDVCQKSFQALLLETDTDCHRACCYGGRLVLALDTPGLPNVYLGVASSTLHKCVCCGVSWLGRTHTFLSGQLSAC